jgi:Tfp pilus assembly protein FimT
MDNVVNQLANELADAISAAVAADERVEACRAKARNASYDVRVTLEAVVAFTNRNGSASVTRVATPARVVGSRHTPDLTANDRRFLRSLRIGCSEGSREPVE